MQIKVRLLQYAFGRTNLADSAVQHSCLIECLAKGLKHGLNDVVRILAIHEIDMEGGAASVNKGSEEFLNQLCVKTSHGFTFKVNMID